MLKRVFDEPGSPPYYVCTECNWAFQALHEANEHSRGCGRAVPTQPVFRSYTTAATFELKDDATQFYTNEVRTWQGLTPEEVLDLFDLNNVYGSKWIQFARTVEAALKKKNT